MLRYGVAGLATLGAYLLAGAVLQRIGLGLAWLAPLAFTAAIVFGYALQRFWVFEDNRRVGASLPRYVAMVAWGYVLNSLALISLAPHMALAWAQVLAAALVVASNAFCTFLWVFPNRSRR